MFIDKPLGISFGRGNDGSAYVIKVDASKGNIDDQVEVFLPFISPLPALHCTAQNLPMSYIMTCWWFTKSDTNLMSDVDRLATG